jgi:bifunctional DNA primase/polymerase-like protein
MSPSGTAVTTGAGTFALALSRYASLGWFVIPLCEPAFGGVCGCGRQHVERAVGKAPLVAWERLAVTPPTPKDLARWAHAWPRAKAGVLLEPSRLLVIDCDSAAALDEARRLGLPPAPVVRTAHGEHRYYASPASVTGRASAAVGQTGPGRQGSLAGVHGLPTALREVRWNIGRGAAHGYAPVWPDLVYIAQTRRSGYQSFASGATLLR